MSGGGEAEERTLVTRAASGDQSAFSALVRMHQDNLYRFIRRYVGDADEAYDLLQEAFVATWESLGRFNPERPFGPWLRRIALNKCRDWSRRRAVRSFFYRALDIETANQSNLTGQSFNTAGEIDILERLDEAVASLPSVLKEPLLLTAFEGLSHQQVAKMLGVSTKAVETRLYRARKLLATAVLVESGGGVPSKR